MKNQDGLKFIRGHLSFLILIILFSFLSACGNDDDHLSSGAKSPFSKADFPFESKFVEVNGYKIHYVDEGDPSKDPILLIHGAPSSSFLYRKIIPHLTEHARVIAFDWIGAGRSEKPPVSEVDYSFVTHRAFLEGFIEKLNLKQITFVLHDWGGPIGFSYAERHPENIKGLVHMESMYFPVPSLDMMPELAQRFISDEGEALIVDQNFFIEKMLPGFILRQLTDSEFQAYAEPYKKSENRQSLLAVPRNVPIAGEPVENHEMFVAFSKYLMTSEVPKLFFHASPGVLVPPEMANLIQSSQSSHPNTRSIDLGEGLHFLQEDHPERIGKEISRWYLKLP